MSTSSPHENGDISAGSSEVKTWVKFEGEGDTVAGGFSEASEKDVEALNQSAEAAAAGLQLSPGVEVGESETDVVGEGAVIDATQVEVKVATSTPGKDVPAVRHTKPQTVNTRDIPPTQVVTNTRSEVSGDKKSDDRDMTLHPIPLESRGRVEQNYENGQLLVSVGPTNEKWAWVSSANFDPEKVPPEFLTPSLSITADDYIMCMEFLTNDYRFNCYTICYRRLIIAWLVFGFAILLGILFAGEKGIVLFGIGVCWLIANACGIVACLYIKAKINRNLEIAVASVNRILMRHKILVGLEDAGKISCHKIHLHFIYYDCAECLTWIEQQIEEKRRKATRKHNRDTQTASPAQTQAASRNSNNNDASASRTDTEIHVDDTVDIVGTRDTNRQQHARMEHAEHILLRYSQVYVKNLCRELLPLRADIPEGLEPHRPRHLPNNYCLCQYVEQNFFRLKPRKWYAGFV